MKNKLHHFYYRFTAIANTRVKIMGIVTILLMVLGIWVTVQVRHTLAVNLGEQLQKQGISVGRDVAARSAKYNFTNNIYALHVLTRDTVNNNEDIRYVFILDSEGMPLVHTFERGIPEGLATLNQLYRGQSHQIEIIETEEGLIYDVAIPIFEGRAGNVRLGMSDRGMRQVIYNTTVNLILSTLAVTLLGLGAAYLMTRVLTKPILELVVAAREVAQGNLQYRAPRIGVKDELGYLVEVFNEMVAGLETSQQAMYQYSAQLKDKEAKLTELLKKVISAQEEERKRIARELHDQTSQSLTSLKLGLEMLYSSLSVPKSLKKVEELSQTANHILQEIHDLALELRPSTLDDLGLVAAIKSYGREWAGKWGIKFDIHSDLIKKKIAPEIEIAIYRVVQEALTNIAKHAQAANVSIVIKYHFDKLTVLVEDDGIGFNVNQVLKSPLKEKKLGLFGMLERISLINGDLTIESIPGEGTTIYIHLPLERVISG